MLPGISSAVYLYWNVRIAVGIEFSLAAVMLFQDSALRLWKEFQNPAPKPVSVNSRECPLASSCLSICPHVSARLPLDGDS
jgi:hypothetical protein